MNNTFDLIKSFKRNDICMDYSNYDSFKSYEIHTPKNIIHVLAHYNRNLYFSKNVKAYICDEYKVKIGENFYWVAKICASNIEIGGTNGFSCVVEDNNQEIICDRDFLYDIDIDNFINNIGDFCFCHTIGYINTKLLFYKIKSINETPIVKEIIIPTYQYGKCFLSLDLTLKSEFDDELNSFKETLKKYKNLGYDLDIDYELEQIKVAYEFIPQCNNFLKSLLEQYNNISQNALNNTEEFEVQVPPTFDKKYYCIAKLSDKAQKIVFDEKNNRYVVTFSPQNIHEAILCLFAMSNGTYTYNKALDSLPLYKQQLIEHNHYLEQTVMPKYDFDSFLFYRIEDYFHELDEYYSGYFDYSRSSVLLTLVKNRNKRLKKELGSIYASILKENRVPTKWKNEYRLFVEISYFCHDTIYQYNPEWIGNQRIDIYIPSANTAIEYQGIQHFQSVNCFGGDKGLENNRARDARKKELCQKNGVKLLYWNYTESVTREAVFSFLKENGIEINENISISSDDDCKEYSILAPIKEREKEEKNIQKKERRISCYIVKYDLSGQYIEKYTSVSEAAQKCSIGKSNIYRVLSGENHIAGGFVWKKYDKDDIPMSIDIDFDVVKAIKNYLHI